MSRNIPPPLADRRLPEGIILIHGGSTERGDGKNLCLMEVVAMLAGEPHGFHPACTSTVVSMMGIEANDLLGNADRQELLELAPELVGTACWHCEENRARAAAMAAGKASADAFQAIGRTFSAGIIRSRQTPQEMLAAIQDALRRYGGSPMNDLTHAAQMASRSLRELDEPGQMGTSASHAVMAVHHCALITGARPADALKAHLRAVIAACPHGITKSALYGTLEGGS